MALHYSEAGQGTPVVLLHGFPLNSTIWRDQQQGLSDRYRVITPDLRGHGRSPAPPGVYEMELLARDVLDLLDTLEVKKAVILGHSMGGYVALAGWKLAPERYLALGLIDSQANADSDDARQGRFKLANRVAAEGAGVLAEAMVPRLFAPQVPATAPIVDRVRQMILTTQLAGLIGVLKGMAARANATKDLANLPIPLMILTGDQDQIIPLETARTMAAGAPTAAFTIVQGAGHMPMLEQPEATTDAIRQFLKNVS